MKSKFLRNWIWTGMGLGLVLTVIWGTCGFSSWKLLSRIINGQFQISNLNFRIVKWCGGGLPFVQQIDKLLSGRYVVLLQNNYELRPSGGFMGSYAVVDFEKGLSVQVKDIYDADGKLPGHVEPPYPIQEAFLQGWWKLRDANWVVDFPRAASEVAWFLEQGGERPVDGIIAVNMEFFKKWLEIVGEVEVITYDQILTSKNFYMLAQRRAEENFVPGSTQKRDFLGAAGTALLERTKSFKLVETIKLIKLMKSELGNRQILVWFRDEKMEREVEKWGWGGDLPKVPAELDYLYVVESNLGANKANCCIKRDLQLIVEGGRPTIAYNLRMVWKNENEFSDKKPPVFWGGDYYNYVRVVVKNSMSNAQYSIIVDGKELRRATGEDFKMPNSLRKEISRDMYDVEEYGDFQVIGFWVITEAKNKSEVQVRWMGEGGRTPRLKGIMVDRQPGIEGFDLQVESDKEKVFEGFVANRQIIWLN